MKLFLCFVGDTIDELLIGANFFPFRFLGFDIVNCKAVLVASGSS
jgi:hypothetical protein